MKKLRTNAQEKKWDLPFMFSLHAMGTPDPRNKFVEVFVETSPWDWEKMLEIKFWSNLLSPTAATFWISFWQVFYILYFFPLPCFTTKQSYHFRTNASSSLNAPRLYIGCFFISPSITVWFLTIITSIKKTINQTSVHYHRHLNQSFHCHSWRY